MTEKLYYLDAYVSEFEATVLGCAEENGRFSIRLDRTAFFPNEGGQDVDTGTLDDIPVTNVIERDGEIFHIAEAPLSVGAAVRGKIDFPARYEKMKCHTAEHILCGIMHRLWGAENVGFHLTDEGVTFDVDVVLSRDQLDLAEDMANDIIAKNVAVSACFPTTEELSWLDYRSKLELSENVRLVSIPDCDLCACCAPHVSRTGEIGLIKMLDYFKHRGGTRIFMLAGRRALCDYRSRYAIARRISALTSTPQDKITEAVEQLILENEAEKNKNSALLKRIAGLEAEKISTTDKNAVCLLEGLGADELREVANIATPRVGGILVLLSGGEGNYKYVISSGSVDLRRASRDINSALNGKGGGRPEMIQGSFYTSLYNIKKYFE
nr:hypothetical protein [Clostridia bacterium]